jgi:hypothetical protein
MMMMMMMMMMTMTMTMTMMSVAGGLREASPCVPTPVRITAPC